MQPGDQATRLSPAQRSGAIQKRREEANVHQKAQREGRLKARRLTHELDAVLTRGTPEQRGQAVTGALRTVREHLHEPPPSAWPLALHELACMLASSSARDDAIVDAATNGDVVTLLLQLLESTVQSFKQGRTVQLDLVAIVVLDVVCALQDLAAAGGRHAAAVMAAVPGLCCVIGDACWIATTTATAAATRSPESPPPLAMVHMEAAALALGYLAGQGADFRRRLLDQEVLHNLVNALQLTTQLLCNGDGSSSSGSSGDSTSSAVKACGAACWALDALLDGGGQQAQMAPVLSGMTAILTTLQQRFGCHTDSSQVGAPLESLMLAVAQLLETCFVTFACWADLDAEAAPLAINTIALVILQQLPVLVTRAAQAHQQSHQRLQQSHQQLQQSLQQPASQQPAHRPPGSSSSVFASDTEMAPPVAHSHITSFSRPATSGDLAVSAPHGESPKDGTAYRVVPLLRTLRHLVGSPADATVAAAAAAPTTATTMAAQRSIIDAFVSPPAACFAGGGGSGGVAAPPPLAEAVGKCVRGALNHRGVLKEAVALLTTLATVGDRQVLETVVDRQMLPPLAALLGNAASDIKTEVAAALLALCGCHDAAPPPPPPPSGGPDQLLLPPLASLLALCGCDDDAPPALLSSGTDQPVLPPWESDVARRRRRVAALRSVLMVPDGGDDNDNVVWYCRPQHPGGQVLGGMIKLLGCYDQYAVRTGLHFVRLVLELLPHGAQAVEQLEGIDALEQLQMKAHPELQALATSLLDQHFGNDYGLDT